MSILRGVISLLAAIDWDAVFPELHVDFSSRGCSMTLNRFSVNSGVRGMLEWKDYRAVDMVLSIVGGYIDCAIGFEIGTRLTAVHSIIPI